LQREKVPRVVTKRVPIGENEGTSATDTFTVAGSGASTIALARVLDSDPLDSSAPLQLGEVTVNHALDLDQSPGTA
jgi:hypothetical protein